MCACGRVHLCSFSRVPVRLVAARPELQPPELRGATPPHNPGFTLPG